MTSFTTTTNNRWTHHRFKLNGRQRCVCVDISSHTRWYSQQQEVTAVFVREVTHINYLTIVEEYGNEQVLEVTDVHPFWVVTDESDLERAAREYADGAYHANITPTENGFWVEAKDLQAGDVFIGVNGELSTLIDIDRVELDEAVTVYNFSVAGNHNYFVIAAGDEYGQTSVLVHNQGQNNYLTVVLYVNLGQFSYDLKTIQDAMNQILADSNSDIRFMLVPTTNSKENLKNNLGFNYNNTYYTPESWWNRKTMFYGHYVRFQSTGPGLATPSTVHIDMILQKLKSLKDAGKDALSAEEVIANILLHEVLWHGLLGKSFHREVPNNTLSSTIASATKPLIITPKQQRSIDNVFRKGNSWYQWL